MKMMQGACFLACSNMSRTREAPTPTNISTKSDPEIVKNGTLASPAMARASRVLPAPRGPLHLAHEVSPETDEQQYGKGGDQQLQEHRLLLRRLAAEFDALRLQQADQCAVAGFRVVSDEGLAGGAPLALDDLALERDRVDVVALHLGEELRIIDGRRLARAHAELT